MNEEKKAIIIGASSGIGRALAVELSRKGYALGLISRRTELLQDLQKKLSATSFVKQADVTRTEEAMVSLSELISEMQGVDLIIINAGTGFPRSNVDWGKEKTTIDTNIVGFAAMANIAFHYFLGKGAGHIVGISSIAAYIPNSGSPAYSASKAFVSNYLQGLRLTADKAGVPVCVTDIKPGFVETPLISDVQGKYWVATPEKAARQIFSVIKKRKKHAYITKRWGLIGWVLQYMPEMFHKYVL